MIFETDSRFREGDDKRPAPYDGLVGKDRFRKVAAFVFGGSPARLLRWRMMGAILRLMPCAPDGASAHQRVRMEEV